MLRQGHESASRLDIMLLKQRFLSVSGQAANPARQHPPVEFVYRSRHPMLQFLPQKLAEWIANNYAEELNVRLRPDPTQPWSTVTLDRILQTCLFSDRKGNTKTFLSTWFSSAPLRSFAWGLLESLNQKEFTGYTSPHLFPLSTSEGLRTSSAEYLSFHAFWTEMQLLLFHISTAADRRTLLSTAVPMVLALTRGGAAMHLESWHFRYQWLKWYIRVYTSIY